MEDLPEDVKKLLDEYKTQEQIEVQINEYRPIFEGVSTKSAIVDKSLEIVHIPACEMSFDEFLLFAKKVNGLIRLRRNQPLD